MSVRKSFFTSKSLLIIFIIAFASSCSSVNNSGSKYENAIKQAESLVAAKKNREAMKLLKESIEGVTPVKSPFVKDSTLYFYANTSSPTLSGLFDGSTYSIFIANDSVRNDPGHNKDDSELYEIIPWNSAVVLKAHYPKVYYMLGALSVEEEDFSQAIKYLDTATYIFEAYAQAWAELVYCYMKQKKYEKAKEIGLNALKVQNVYLDKIGTASILRKLGYVAIEENELQKAEEYFKESIELDDTKLARDELEYIEKMKKK